MTVLLVGAALMLSGFPQPDPYDPIHEGCRTKACDDRVSARERKKMMAQKRRVQARHKAAVRAERHTAKMLNVIRPYRGWLASTRACESPTGRDSANGMYHGYYQFDVQSWRGAGGTGMPCQASFLEQSYRAVIWLKMAGRDAWPVCG